MIHEILDYHFNNPSLLQEALTHPSLCVKRNDVEFSYERLEFLGDSVIGLVIAEFLIKKFPNEDEGRLAKKKSYLVSGDIVAKIAHDTGLGVAISMTSSEEKSGGRDNLHTLENTLEAIMGAIYLDSDLSVVKKIINRLWESYINLMPPIVTDPKSRLQEFLQKNGYDLPKYEVIGSTGPGHMLTFQIRLKIIGFEEVIAEGKSKKEAEKEAASLFLKQIEKK